MTECFITKDSKGKFRIIELTCHWSEDFNGFIINRTTGCLHGKQIKQPELLISCGKAGRTVTQQKDLKLASLKKEYLDKGYIEVEKHPNEYSESELSSLFGETVTNQFGVIKPMLCKKIQDVTNLKIFEKEWLASRKINGVRALFYWDGNEMHVASRGGTNYDCSTIHLRKHSTLIEIFKSNPTLILDSELYKFGKSLQQCSGAARLEKNAYDCDWLEMYVYDCYFVDRPDLSAKDRINFLSDLATKYNFSFDPYKTWNKDELQIQIVPHETITGIDNIWKLHNKFVLEGWEGLVIRDPKKSYSPNSRGLSMIKIKQYIDETFKVVGYELGLRGSEDMVFICEMDDGRTFKAMPIGNRDIKQGYVDNFDTKYRNHLGDCKYFELSDEGIPCQPKFLAFRFDLE